MALGHGVCPYYLSQELARWADVIVGDYNYYFDSSAMLFALAETNRWRVSVLVDGRILATGSPMDIRADERVRAAYLGDEEFA